MRQIPVDMTRVSLIATGKLAPKPKYVRLADGGSKRVDGQQETDEHGAPLWVIDCMVDDGTEDEDGRAEIIGVTLASHDRPKVNKFQPIQFQQVNASVYVNKGTGRLTTSMSASGIGVTGKAV